MPYVPVAAVAAVVGAQPITLRAGADEAVQVGDGIPPLPVCPLAGARPQLRSLRHHGSALLIGCRFRGHRWPFIGRLRSL
jgi:hypothetical protein